MNLKDYPDEISFESILTFFITTWKLILLCALLGVFLSIIYLSVAPKIYEANVYIRLASFNLFKSSSVDQLIVQQPKDLILEYSNAIFLSEKVASKCGINVNLTDRYEDGLNFKILLQKDVKDTVKVQAFSSSQKSAYECVQAIFNQIKTDQDNLASVIGENLNLVKSAESRVNSSTSRLISFKYEPARVMNSIYSYKTPSSPKTNKALLVGFASGIFFGVLFAFSSQVFLRILRTNRC